QPRKPGLLQLVVVLRSGPQRQRQGGMMEIAALTQSDSATEAITQAEPPTRTSDALTLRNEQSERCSNPFCDGTARRSRKHGRYCSDNCRMDGYALKRAKALLDQVGVIEFNRLLDDL